MAKFTRSSWGKITRRINDRMNKLTAELGSDSDLVQREMSMIEKIIPSENIRFNKNGAMQIIKPSTLQKNEELSIMDLEGLSDRIRSWGEIKSSYLPEAKEYAGGKVSKKALKQYINSVNEMFNKLPDIYKKIKDLKDNPSEDEDERSEQEEAILTFENSIKNTDRTSQDINEAFGAVQVFFSF